MNRLGAGLHPAFLQSGTSSFTEFVAAIAPEVLHNVNGVQGWSAFRQDIQSVDWVGVSIERNSAMSSQSYFLAVAARIAYMSRNFQPVSTCRSGKGGFEG